VEQLESDRQEQSKTRLRFIEAALEAAKAGVVVIENDGHVVLANAEGRELLASQLSTLGGQALARHELPVGRALATGHGDEQILIREAPDGSLALLLGEGNPIRDESGAVVGAVGTFVDAMPQDLTQVLDGAPVGIAVLRGPDLVYEYVNAAYQAFTPGHPLIGRPFGEGSRELS
jgi:PAS domain-containing protein